MKGVMLMWVDGVDLSKPVKILDGSVVPVESGWGEWGLWMWIMGGVWGVALLIVAWVAVMRQRNRVGAGERVLRRGARWRGLNTGEVKWLRGMVNEIEGKGEESVIAALLLPSVAEVILDRSWDRTEGVKRAGLIRLRGKLGVLDAGRKENKEERAESDGAGLGAGARIVSASSPIAGDGGAA